MELTGGFQVDFRQSFFHLHGKMHTQPNLKRIKSLSKLFPLALTRWMATERDVTKLALQGNIQLLWRPQQWAKSHRRAGDCVTKKSSCEGTTVPLIQLPTGVCVCVCVCVCVWVGGRKVGGCS